MVVCRLLHISFIYRGLSGIQPYNQLNMKNNILKEHLLNTDLSFVSIKNNDFLKIKKKDLVYKIEALKPPCWTSEIKKIETFLKKTNLPEKVILDCCSIIMNVDKFIDSHLTIVKIHNGNKIYLPYLTRLTNLQKKLLQ